MKKALSLLLVIVIVGISLASCMPNLKKYSIRFADDAMDVNLSDMRNEGYLAFLDKLEGFSSKLTLGVYGSVGKNQNFCISPVSVFMALAIACEGSAGETRDEILEALGVSYDELREYTKYLYAFRNRSFSEEKLTGGEQVTAFEQLSNSIWFDNSVLYNEYTVRSLASNYNCDIFSASFKNDTAEKIIGQYIEYKTHGKVDGNVSFSNDTMFAIINTFYLKEIWNELGKSLTRTLEYHSFLNTDNETVKLQLLKGNYVPGKVYEDDDFSSFYTQTEHGYRLHFIVPAENKRLSDVFNVKSIEKVLSIEDYGYVDDENRMLHNTRIYFPEFDVSYSSDLSGVLEEAFGVKSLFDAETCDFSGLISQPAYCNKLIHKCRLNVDTKGIDGAAVTVLTGATSPGPSEYEEVYHDYFIDRAFGFVLTDSYGTVLFSGAISNLD